jgi:hypothetical protein
MILQIDQIAVDRTWRKVLYKATIELLTPHRMEKGKKMERASKIRDLRPEMSLNLA